MNTWSWKAAVPINDAPCVTADAGLGDSPKPGLFGRLLPPLLQEAASW